jgi:hypothetical protein
MPLKSVKNLPFNFTPKLKKNSETTETTETTYSVWDPNYDWTIHLYEDFDVWKATFGYELSAICEFCNEKILYKNKSHYRFVKKNENPRLLLQCPICSNEQFSGNKIKKKYTVSTKDEDNIIQPIMDPTNIDECINKLPKRLYLWKKFHKRNKDTCCALCDTLLEKFTCFSWYKKLPSEGGFQIMDNFTLVCGDCRINMTKKKKGLESYKKRYCNKE